MMRNISDIIEEHLKLIIEKSNQDYIVIQRSELADKFQCVPSQINYVINTRFTLEKGYLVESKRGGGGFIRIKKVKLGSNQQVLQTVLELIEQSVTQASAEDIIDRLMETGIATAREGRLMKAVIQRSVLTFNIQIRDQLRANLLKAMLMALMYK
jgi:transcriptional regulator CtsR